MTIPEIKKGNFKFNSKAETPLELPEQQQPQQPEEESIEKFKAKYNNLLIEKIMPILKTYEGERKKRFMLALVSTGIIVAIGIFAAFNLSGRSSGDALGLCCGGAVALWAYIKKSFERKVKGKVMPILMRAIPNFYWQKTSPMSFEDIANAKIIPEENSCSKSFDDCFIGKYKGVEILISECTYEIRRSKSTTTVFNGVVIRLKMNKKFEGMTVIRPKHVPVTSCTDLKKSGMTEVKLEDPEFMKEYTVYSTDQIEARYLLTTSFMERFKNITLAFFSQGSFCSFYEDYVYIAPYTTGDLFEIGSLVRSITNTTQFELLLEEFLSIIQLVEHFKLDKKLGL